MILSPAALLTAPKKTKTKKLAQTVSNLNIYSAVSCLPMSVIEYSLCTVCLVIEEWLVNNLGLP